MEQPEQQFPDAPLSIPKQVDLLIERGMEIADRAAAERWLNNVSFHRMRGYWEPFESASEGNGVRAFQDGVAFASVVERYDFDQRLRNLLLDACDHIEVSLRTQWVHNVAYVSGVGRFAHLDATLFARYHSDNLDKLQHDYEEYSRSKYPYRFQDCPMERINPFTGWRQRLTALLDEYGHIPHDSMGMPSDWQAKLLSVCEAASGS